MRIISGTLKGRRLNPKMDHWPTRPTTDYAKEGLFNVLTNRFYFDEIKALDLFGGTAGITFELISRGCTNVTYIDSLGAAHKFVTQCAETFRVEDSLTCLRTDVFRFLSTTKMKYDFIFADPPYALREIDSIPDTIADRQLLNSEGIFVMEHNPNHNFELHPTFVEERRYGKTCFSFFQSPLDIHSK